MSRGQAAREPGMGFGSTGEGSVGAEDSRRTQDVVYAVGVFREQGSDARDSSSRDGAEGYMNGVPCGDGRDEGLELSRVELGLISRSFERPTIARSVQADIAARPFQPQMLQPPIVKSLAKNNANLATPRARNTPSHQHPSPSHYQPYPHLQAKASYNFFPILGSAMSGHPSCQACTHRGYAGCVYLPCISSMAKKKKKKKAREGKTSGDVRLRWWWYRYGLRCGGHFDVYRNE
ncbi:hypothetical protein B0O99DRAFT_343135 [Bisporella sp. PMI_857]|nr:hypothetical protein B0O99DRAFT_343135 [Bisporella sp. PMI_857]